MVVVIAGLRLTYFLLWVGQVAVPETVAPDRFSEMRLDP